MAEWSFKMGKGARSREKYSVKKEKLKVEAVEQAKKDKKSKIIGSITAIVIALAILSGTFIYFFFYASGKYLRDEIGVKSDTYSVDNAMMTYFVKSNYVGMQSQYGEYFYTMTGINPALSLKSQYVDGTTSWFTNILESAKTSVADVLYLAEEAKATGLSLSEDELKMIDDLAGNFDPYYTEDGVNVDDIKNALEINILAQKYANEFLTSLEYDSEEIETYFEENSNEYETISYDKYVINYAEGQEEGIVPFDSETAKEKADELAAVETSEEFVELTRELISEQNPGIENADLDADLLALRSETVSYVEEDEFSEWAFSEDREVNETYVVSDEEASTYTVYLLASLPERNEEETIEIKRLLLSSSSYASTEEMAAKAEEIVEIFNQNPNEEEFNSLILEYSDDSSSIMSQGSYEGVVEGEFGVDSIDEWLFADERVSGDVEMITTDYGIEILYFVNQGNEKWYEDVVFDKESAAYEENSTALESKYTIEFNDEILNKIPM